MTVKPEDPASPCRIRFATESDTSLIVQLIKELAEYEKLAHEAVVDEHSVRATLFKKTPAAEVLIAEYQDQPAAFALFFHNYSTFLGKPGLYLEDLYVKPELRGRGIGKQILTCLAQVALARDCGRLEGAVLDWNEPAISFYQNLGAVPLSDWTVFRITGPALSALARTESDPAPGF